MLPQKIKSAKYKTSLLLLVFSLILFSQLLPAVSAEYKIQEGDTFYYDILEFRTPQGYILELKLADMIFTEGDSVSIEITLVDPPLFEFRINPANGESEEFNAFSNIIIKNCNWTEQRDEFERSGYEVTETDEKFTATFYTNGYNYEDGIIRASYWKEDGVLSDLYTYNYSLLPSEYSLMTMKIERNFPSKTSPLLVIIAFPVSFLTVVIIYRKKIAK